MKLSKQIIKSVPLTMRVIRKIVLDYADDSLTLPQLRILRFIQEGCGQVSGLSRTLGVTQAAISKMVDGLVEKEYITRSSGTDRRVTKLDLTEKGEAVNSSVHLILEAALDTRLKNITKSEKEDLSKGLAVLTKLFNNESCS